MVGLDKKKLGFYHLFFFLSTQLNTLQKNLSPYFLSKVFSTLFHIQINTPLVYFFFLFFRYWVFGLQCLWDINLGKSKLQLYLLGYKILNRRNSHWGISKAYSISTRYKILTLFVHFLLFGNGFLLIQVVCLCYFDIFIGWDIFWSTPFL